MRCVRLLGVATLVLLFSMEPAWAQRRPNPTTVPDVNAEITPDPETQKESQRLRQKKRFEDMKRDSQKLLDLATELKQYVDKSGEHELSLNVVRKAEEIEKLARQVKTNMRGD
jgi:hypothetical protein